MVGCVIAVVRYTGLQNESSVYESVYCTAVHCRSEMSVAWCMDLCA